MNGPLTDEVSPMTGKEMKIWEEYQNLCKFTTDAQEKCAIYKAQNKELEAEISQLKSKLWVSNDAQLRTYDGLAQKADRHDRMEAALRALVDAFVVYEGDAEAAADQAEEALEAAREALATWP